MNFCKFANIFGKPNEGVHKYRLFDIAIVDVLATLVLGYIISKITNYNLSYIYITLFILGIIMHKIFCVKTTVHKFLFDD